MAASWQALSSCEMARIPRCSCMSVRWGLATSWRATRRSSACSVSSPEPWNTAGAVPAGAQKLDGAAVVLPAEGLVRRAAAAGLTLPLCPNAARLPRQRGAYAPATTSACHACRASSNEGATGAATLPFHLGRQLTAALIVALPVSGPVLPAGCRAAVCARRWWPAGELQRVLKLLSSTPLTSR
jgi:hypothetical protein